MAKTRKRAARGPVTAAEVATQFGAELPDREAMSLLLPSTGGLPLGGTTDPASPTGGTTGGTTPYAGDTTGSALDQTATAQHMASTSGTSGTNVPNGTATASSTT